MKITKVWFNYCTIGCCSLILAGAALCKDKVIAHSQHELHAGGKAYKIEVVQHDISEDQCFGRSLIFSWVNPKELTNAKVDISPFCPDHPTVVNIVALNNGFQIEDRDVSSLASYSSVKLNVLVDGTGRMLVRKIDYVMQRQAFDRIVYVGYLIDVDKKSIAKFNLACEHSLTRSGLVYQKKIALGQLQLNKLGPYFYEGLLPDDNAKREDLVALDLACNGG